MADHAPNASETTDASRLPLPSWQDHALFLDFDGTLTPIVARPEDVRLSRATLALLERLIAEADGAVAILSGRALDDLKAHLHGLPLALSGSHGLEYRFPGHRAQLADDVSPEALDATFERLAPFARDQGLRLERKPGAIALHFRNRPECASDCREAVTRAAAAHALRVLHGNMVSEATFADMDKGRALRRFLAEPLFATRIPVMLGDDTTDEDAFCAAQDLGGFGVRIGPGDTIARFRVPRMEDALAWLEESLNSRTIGNRKGWPGNGS